jgi:hypothetical protein
MDPQREVIDEKRLRKMDSVDDKACSFELSNQIKEQVTFRYQFVVATE